MRQFPIVHQVLDFVKRDEPRSDAFVFVKGNGFRPFAFERE